jgi:hypothetical protein
MCCRSCAVRVAKIDAPRTVVPLPAVPGAAAVALPGGPLPSTPAQSVPTPQADVQAEQEWIQTPEEAMATPDPAAASDCPAGVTPPSARYTPGQPAVASSLLAGFTPSPEPAVACRAQPRPSSRCSGSSEEEGDALPAAWLPAAIGGPQVAHGTKPAFVAWTNMGKAG